MAALPVDAQITIYGAPEDRAAIESLGFEYASSADAPKDWHLTLDAGALVLRKGRSRVTFNPNDTTRRAQSRSQSPLARACGNAMHVHDAMAGWGTDGLALAALGYRVHCSERSGTVFALLRQRIEGANNITCALEDARDYWDATPRIDVVYLDPMFEPHPKTALPSLPMQALRTLTQADADDNLREMVDHARNFARVVVKRRAKSRALLEPDWRIAAKTVRFDVYERHDTILDSP